VVSQSLLPRSFSEVDQSVESIDFVSSIEHGLLFLSHYAAHLESKDKLDKESSKCLDYIIEILDDESYELERQRGLVFGESESTGPHTSQFEYNPGSPEFIFVELHGYGKR